MGRTFTSYEKDVPPDDHRGPLFNNYSILTIHKEGTTSLLLAFVLGAALTIFAYFYFPYAWPYIAALALAFFLIILQFFRNPNRRISSVDDTKVLAPADGKVVVIEEVQEPEYFNDRRLQVSIFMSPVNVHVNRNPISGIVRYFKYHKGKYLVAWHPKSSTENERTTTVIEKDGKAILLRQIAGALAKRIVNYVKEGQQVTQGHDMGFIKFGSRVDLLLPLDADIKVSIGDKVTGNRTIIAEI